MTVRKSIHVKRPVERTFRLFTEEIGKWWPAGSGREHGLETSGTATTAAGTGCSRASAHTASHPERDLRRR